MSWVVGSKYQIFYPNQTSFSLNVLIKVGPRLDWICILTSSCEHL